MTLAYQLVYSTKRRSVALQIKQGQLTVRAPVGISEADIQRLIIAKQPWIDKHLKLAKTQVPPDWMALKTLPFQQRQLTFDVRLSSQSGIRWSDDKLQISLSSRCQAKNLDVHVRKQIKHWYQQQAQQWFGQRLAYWQQQMELTAVRFVIGDWKSRWGYCNSKAELGFNWRLMMVPDWVADYVVVHELAHLRYLNHSAKFWQLVHKHYPGAKAAAEFLKQNQYWMNI